MFTKDEVIETMALCLNERETEILFHLGINDGIPIRFEEIKEGCGITIEQMRDMEKRVSQHIRESRNR